MREMKDSGVEWIGAIPSTWTIRKGASVYTVTTGKLDVNAEEPNGIYPFFTCSMFPKKINKYAFDCEALLIAGNGQVGFTQYYNGKFNAYQRTYVLNDFKDISPVFLKHYVSTNLVTELEPKSVGAIIQFIKLSDLKSFNIVTPPLETQHRIADYLDRKCSKIDEIIEKESLVIEKLKAYKLSVITEAVTKGLNPDAPMKDSGIEWIGEIPEHWSIGKVSYFFDIQLGKMLQPKQNNKNDTLENYLCAINVGNNTLKLNSFKQMWFSEYEKSTYNLKTGDLLVVEGGDVASSDIIKDDIENLYFQNALHRVRSKSNMDIRILRYLLIVAKGKGHIDLICNKATIAHFSKEKFMSLECISLPTNEQQAISKYLDKKCAQIDETITKKQATIEKLTAYKKSLIYEVVTGKKEV